MRWAGTSTRRPRRSSERTVRVVHLWCPALILIHFKMPRLLPLSALAPQVRVLPGMSFVARVLARSTARLAPCRRLVTQHWSRTLCSQPPLTDREAEALLAGLQEADRQAIRQAYLESVAAAADFVDSLQPAEPSEGDTHTADAAATLPPSVMGRDGATSAAVGPTANDSTLAAAAVSPTANDSALAARLDEYLVDWARGIAADPALLAKDWLRSLRRAVRRDLVDSADMGSASPSLMDADELLACLGRLSARGALGAPGAPLQVAIEHKRGERAATPPGFASTVWRSTHGLDMKAWREGAEGARPAPRRRAGSAPAGPRDWSHRVEASGEESLPDSARTTSGATDRGNADGGGSDIFGTPEYRGFVSSRSSHSRRKRRS